MREKTMGGKIFVQDDFFDLATLQKIQKVAVSLEYKTREGAQEDIHNEKHTKRYYLEHPVPIESEVAREVRRLVKKYFFREVDTYNEKKPHETSYFLAKPIPATPHIDARYPGSEIYHNCLIYIKGEFLLNNGTGFYENINEKLHLNTHIGFKENRAIFFNGNIFHASLQWADKNSSFRYCMANFFCLKPV